MLRFGSFEQFLGFLLGVFDSTHIQEGLLGQIVNLAIKNSIESLDSLFDRYHYTRQTGEL